MRRFEVGTKVAVTSNTGKVYTGIYKGTKAISHLKDKEYHVIEVPSETGRGTNNLYIGASKENNIKPVGLKGRIKKSIESATDQMQEYGYAEGMCLEFGITITADTEEMAVEIFEALNNELRVEDMELTGEYEVEEKNGKFILNDYTIQEYERGDRGYTIGKFNEIYKEFKKGLK